MKQIIALVTIVLFLVPLYASAQNFCNGNFDYDEDVDGTDAFTFKTDYGRSALENPCPPDGPAPVQKTGQDIIYGYRDDGYWQQARGVEWPDPRFTDNGDGTVTDNLTGLIWLKDADCSIFHAPRTWDYTLTVLIPQLEDGYCGLTDGSSPGDWRLPNYRELFSIMDAKNFNQALPTGHPFTNVQSEFYWTSTTHADIDDAAWYVYLGDGRVSYHNKTVYSHFLWPVRGGQ